MEEYHAWLTNIDDPARVISRLNSHELCGLEKASLLPRNWGGAVRIFHPKRQRTQLRWKWWMFSPDANRANRCQGNFLADLAKAREDRQWSQEWPPGEVGSGMPWCPLKAFKASNRMKPENPLRVSIYQFCVSIGFTTCERGLISYDIPWGINFRSAGLSADE